MKNQRAWFTLLSLALAFFALGASTAQTTEETIEIIVQSSQDSGSGTLRETLQNAKPGTVIRFSSEVFPIESPETIQVLSGLPSLEAGSITIDASNAGVILDGSKLSHNSGITGLAIESDSNIILGLQIINFPGAGIGIYDGAQENRIGGTGQREGNVIGGNWDGIGISGSGTDNNLVIGNFIGTDSSGTVGNGNIVDGVWIGNGAQHNLIGGANEGARNVISANGSSGVVIDNGMYNTISGNYIGTDITGIKALGNGKGGVTLALGSQYNLIGGTKLGEGNVISGNELWGIMVANPETSYNTVSGNDIGLGKDGKTAVGNKGTGIIVGLGAQYNEIGPGNLIAYNGLGGIHVGDETTIGNIITRNSIYDNQGAAISNLDGSSLEISPPEIDRVSGRSVRGQAGPDQLIEIFSDVGDESSVFEGETTADASGAFHFLLPSGSFKNPFITTTARDQDGNTSQLSASMEVPAQSVGKELPGIVAPAQVSTEPAVIGTNLALAGVAVLFFGFTSTAFNDILKSHSPDISAAFARIFPVNVRSFFSRKKEDRPSSKGMGWKFIRMWLVIILVSAIIESFLDPNIPLLGSERLSVVLTLFAAGLVVSGLEWITDHYSHRKFVKTAVPRGDIHTMGILLGIGSVLFSRLMHFTPGYIFGIVGIIYLLPDIEGKKESGQRALLVLATLFIGGLLLWLLTAFLPEKLLWMEPFMLTAFLISLQGVLFELIPLDIFDGSALWKWRKGVWFLFFALVFFCFFHFMLNPAGSDMQALQQNSVKTLMIVMAVFGLVTLVAWLLFSKRRNK